MPIMRILLGEIGTTWKSSIRELAKQHTGVEIVGEARDSLDVLLQVRNEHADVVIISQTPEGNEPGICSHLLLEYPNVVLILVPSDGGADVLCRMILCKEVRQASKEALLSMLEMRDSAA